jgi:magnesium transporter
MITVYRWTCSDRTCERVEADQLPASAAEVTGEDVVWVDLAAPTPDEEQLVFERFLKVHRLSLEDITKPRREARQGAHLPKVEEFPGRARGGRIDTDHN